MLRPDLVIPTRDYSSRNGARIRAGVFHTAEGSRDVVSLGQYFATTERDVSSHWGADDTRLALYVPETWSAWTALNANPFSVQVELCAFADWDRAEWLQHYGMLRNAARLAAEWSGDYGLALRHGSVADLRNRVPALYDHYDVTRALGGTHVDVGPGFPWDVMLDMARRFRAGLPVEDDMWTDEDTQKFLSFKSDWNNSGKATSLASLLSSTLGKATTAASVGAETIKDLREVTGPKIDRVAAGVSDLAGHEVTLSEADRAAVVDMLRADVTEIVQDAVKAVLEQLRAKFSVDPT